MARRDFLRLGATAAGIALAGCSGGTAPRPARTVATGSDFRVGVVLPAAGPGAAIGDSIRAGMRLSFAESGYEAAGRRVVEVAGDEGSGDAATPLAAVRQLVEGEGVELVTGIVASASALAIRGYLDRGRVPTLIAGAGVDDVSRGLRSPYVYRTSYSNWQIGQPLGSALAARGIRRLALVYTNDADGVEMAAAVKETYTGQVTAEVRPPPAGAGGDGAAIAQLDALRPDAVCALLSGPDAVAFLREARSQLDPGIQVTGSGFLVEPGVLGAIGAAVPVGAVTGLHWAETLAGPVNRSFTAAFQRAYGRPADVFAVQGYDTARVIVEALRSAGGRTADRAAFMRAIGQVDFLSPRGRFRFDAGSNNVVDALYLRQLAGDPGHGYSNRVIAAIQGVTDPGR